VAIFSLHDCFIGRITHPAGAASLHARYVTRNEALAMPLDRQVYAWLDKREKEDRKNARVIDRLHVVPPSDFSREQNIELLQAYRGGLIRGRASWTAAIHGGPGNADNPRAQIILPHSSAIVAWIPGGA
jgi:hypothetical protein